MRELLRNQRLPPQAIPRRRASACVVLSSAVAVLVWWATPIAAQDAVGTISLGGHTFLFPISARVDSTSGLRVLRAVSAAVIVRGLPADAVANRSVVVSLGTDIDPNVDAVSYADQSLIVLPMQRWKSWTNAKLTRVIRHEVAHLAFRTYLRGANAPLWLNEGFAEWSAGPLTCEYETLLRLDLSTNGDRATRRFFLTDASRGATQLGTAYFSTFLEYLDREGAVSDGRLLGAVRQHGISTALRQLFGSTLESLEKQWWSALVDSYRGMHPNATNCDF